ncbi:MAG: hypothetical protein WC503_01095 [Candidatus Shapirobacteria bacterium]
MKLILEGPTKTGKDLLIRELQKYIHDLVVLYSPADNLNAVADLESRKYVWEVTYNTHAYSANINTSRNIVVYRSPITELVANEFYGRKFESPVHRDYVYSWIDNNYKEWEWLFLYHDLEVSDQEMMTKLIGKRTLEEIKREQSIYKPHYDYVKETFFKNTHSFTCKSSLNIFDMLDDYFEKSVKPKLKFQDNYIFMDIDGVAIPYDKEFAFSINPTYEYCAEKVRRANLSYLHLLLRDYSFHDLFFFSARCSQPNMEAAIRNNFNLKFFNFIWNIMSPNTLLSGALYKPYIVYKTLEYLYNEKKNFKFIYLDDCFSYISNSYITALNLFEDDRNIKISSGRFNLLNNVYKLEVIK